MNVETKDEEHEEDSNNPLMDVSFLRYQEMWSLEEYILLMI